MGFYFDEETGCDACTNCGAFLGEDDGYNASSATSSECDHIHTEQASRQFVGEPEPFTSDENAETLWHAYWFARRRYRAFTGRDPRRRRFPKRASWARGGKSTRRKGYRGRFARRSGPKGFAFKGMPSIGARSLAGGKGAGKKGGPRTGKGNGIDPATGLPRTCFRCDSDQHMVGDCPVPRGQGKGKGKGGGKQKAGAKGKTGGIGKGRKNRW